MSCAAVAVLEVNGQTTQRTATRPATPRMATSHATLSPDSQKALINDYCAGCHDDDGEDRRAVAEHFDAAHAEQQADVAEKMIRKLRAGMMPPPAATDAARRGDADRVCRSRSKRASTPRPRAIRIRAGVRSSG